MAFAHRPVPPLFHVVAFSLFAFYLAETGSETGKVDFATMGAPVAYVVLILSWLVTMLAIQSLVFAGAEKYYACFGSERVDSQGQTKPSTRKRNVDWTQRPLPLTIVNVVQNGERELYRNPAMTVPKTANTRLVELEEAMKLNVPPALKTTYNHWPGQM
ncbi:hypothetical protein BC835DRAFT_1383864 [Cytidiella melzeri]|nr:hypothetical protein BC835DRAFT_1383864 [Cytidiella melzeri]